MEPEAKNEYNTGVENDDIRAIKAYKQQVIARRKCFELFPKRGVSVIIVTNKPHYINNIFANIRRSTYPEKEFLIILNSNCIPASEFEKRAASYSNIRIFRLDDSVTLGECLNFGVREAKYDYIAKMDDDDYYGPNYLLDQMDLFYDPKIDILSICNQFIEFEHNHRLYVVLSLGEYQNITHGSGATMLARRRVFDTISFQPVNCDEDRLFFIDCVKHHFTIYSGSNFNYLYKRHAKLQNHTFQIDDTFFLSFSQKLNVDCDFESLITV